MYKLCETVPIEVTLLTEPTAAYVGELALTFSDKTIVIYLSHAALLFFKVLFEI